MIILGLTKTTLLDYPGKVAATVFTGGCNFRCPFCHNGHLITNIDSYESISEETVLEHLEKRKNVLEGVCITGGEPTINTDLSDFIRKIREMGYKIKLDTNGTNPGMLDALIKEKLIDYIAMDIKNSKEKYIVSAECNAEQLKDIERSVEILKSSNIEYEFRTTLVRELHEKEDIEKTAEWIKGCPKWYIQSYVESENVLEKRFSSYSKEEILSLIQEIKGINIELRGID